MRATVRHVDSIWVITKLHEPEWFVCRLQTRGTESAGPITSGHLERLIANLSDRTARHQSDRVSAEERESFRFIWPTVSERAQHIGEIELNFGDRDGGHKKRRPAGSLQWWSS